MATLAKGDVSTGSLWNKNSWHWEEKDYNKASRDFIISAIEGITFSSDVTLRFRDVIPTGFASISVRKGKKVVVFEYAITAKYCSSSGSGMVSIPEFSNDELDPICRVSLECGEESVEVFVRQTGSKAIKEALGRFVDFINSAETGDELLHADKQRREAELAEAKKAEIEKGTEKKQIAEKIKALEQEAIADKKFVEASVWNPNSYHWETRKLDKWAAEWIKSQLNEDSFENIQVSGEAENSIRKGKKISVFTLKISGRFKGAEFNVPNFSNESGDDEIPKLVYAESDKTELLHILETAVFRVFLDQLNGQ